MKTLLSLSASLFLLGAPCFAGIEDFNFAPVVVNDTYQIYRSSALGAEGVREVWAHLKAQGLPAPKTIVYMNDEGYKDALFSSEYALEEWALQDEFGYKLYHSFDYKNRTYLDGWDPSKPSEDIDANGKLNETAVAIFGPDPKDGVDGGLDAFHRILGLVLDPANQPVLFHCRGGKHRTGMVGMALRYIQSERARDVVSKLPVFKTRAELEYVKHAGVSSRPQNVKFLRAFIASPEFRDYQARFRPLLQ